MKLNNRLVTTTVTAPLDMIKTTMYASGDYGVMELTHKIVDTEGFRGLLRGWSAAYVRLGKLETKKTIYPYARFFMTFTLQQK